MPRPSSATHGEFRIRAATNAALAALAIMVGGAIPLPAADWQPDRTVLPVKMPTITGD